MDPINVKNDIKLVSESLADINIAHEENDEGTQGHHHHRGRPRARKTFTKSGQQTISAQPDCDGMNKRNSSKKNSTKNMLSSNSVPVIEEESLRVAELSDSMQQKQQQQQQEQPPKNPRKKKSIQRKPQLIPNVEEEVQKKEDGKQHTPKNEPVRKKSARKKGVVQSNNGVDDSKEATISSENPICPEKDITTIEASSDPTLKSVSTKTRKDKTKAGKNENKNNDSAPPKSLKKERQKDGNQSTTTPKEIGNNTLPNNKNKREEVPDVVSIPPNQPQLTNDINYGKGKPIVVLHIGEKPSIAQAVAKGLCPSSSASASKGKSLPVYEFTVTNLPFPKAPNASKVTHKVTSVAGHVFSVDFAPQFQSWEIDPVLLFTAPIVRKPCQASVVKHLQNEATGVDFIVLWMDCDREGENINFETLDCCLASMKGSSTAYDRVYRAYFSAINPTDIQKAYQKLGKPDKNQSLSVDARQELDLKVGVAFSRFQTKFFQGRYGDLDSAVLSYGPCQTPTLGFCVQRYLSIQTFTPEPYWLLDLNIFKRGRVCKATWDAGRSFNRKKVEQLLEKCWENKLSSSSSATTVKVVSVSSKQKKQGRPTPLNTVALLKACSKALGIGPHQAMGAAERLYLLGYLSYPRTESTAYPKSFDVQGTLQTQTNDPRWGPYVRDLLQDGPNQSKRGVDVGDHPPITPCRSASPGDLSGDMARVYELVVRHFIATVSRDAEWQATKVVLDVNVLEEFGKFTIRGKQLISPGFLAVLLHKGYDDVQDDPDGDNEEEEEEKNLPDFLEGEEIVLSSSQSGTGKISTTAAYSTDSRATLAIKEKETTAPSLLSESELITLMERNGIGTDASIPTHIENILKRNYVSLVSGRRLEPTKLGLVLAQGYHLIDSSLVLPKVRAEIEGECNKIAKGLASKQNVVQKALKIFEGKYTFFVENISKMDMLFGSSFAKLEDVGKPFSRCGITRRYLQLILGPPPRLYNKYTETVYALPCGGAVKQWSGKKCPFAECNFELCLYTVGSPGRTYPLCPNCFNNPKEEWGGSSIQESRVDEEDNNKEMKLQRLAGRTLTLDCPLPDGHPAITEMAVMQDNENEGYFILDPTSLGAKWRLVSTRGPTTIHMPQGTEKVTVLDKIDNDSGCHYIQIDFSEGKSPLPDGSTRRICFLPKDEIILSKIRTFQGSERSKGSSNRGRGHGRKASGRQGGRGRGGGLR